jgi:hypothetical protein
MSRLRIVYLLLAIWGAVHPMLYFHGWLAAHQFDLTTLLAAWTANDAVTGLSLDLVISAVALIVWILAEVAVRRNFGALWAVPATLFIGVSCGLPLYLFLRTRPV